MELKHNFYGVNFAPFPRRGVLSSETAQRSMAAMAEAHRQLCQRRVAGAHQLF